MNATENKNLSVNCGILGPCRERVLNLQCFLDDAENHFGCDGAHAGAEMFFAPGNIPSVVPIILQAFAGTNRIANELEWTVIGENGFVEGRRFDDDLMWNFHRRR